jgi:hypothetical protein
MLISTLPENSHAVLLFLLFLLPAMWLVGATEGVGGRPTFVYWLVLFRECEGRTISFDLDLRNISRRGRKSPAGTGGGRVVFGARYWLMHCIMS